ncbi:hypothetical protein DFAR_2800002 [Desulfarculales bacterium]
MAWFRALFFKAMERFRAQDSLGAGKKASSNSRTHSCAWTPPPLPCA